jgi:glycerol kinase
MTSKYIAAIDQGTSSTRCILFDRQGNIKGFSQREHRQIYPKAGWVEHDPVEIWKNAQDVITSIFTSNDVLPGQIIAIGITNQRETTVVWNRFTGKPYGNAIVWQDTRTSQLCKQLSENGGPDRFRARVGLPLTTYFSGPKVVWLMQNADADFAQAINLGEVIFGNIDSWLIWWLTGGPDGGNHVTDVTNASRTMLMNLSTLDWDQQILDELGIPRAILPKILPSSHPKLFGQTSSSGPFHAQIPICGVLGDQQAALVGQTCFNPGEAKNTYGTGCFTLLNTGKIPIPSNFGLLTTVGYKFGDEPAIYALEGSIAIAGALVQWMRDNLGLIEKSSDIESLARSVEDNGGIYFVPAFSGLFAPYWKSDARGVIAGLTRFTNKGHLARAVLEATSYQTREVLEAMEKDSGVNLQSLRVDGGMVGNQLLMQFQSDILGVPVVRPKIAETTALGAAYAAGLATGYWENLAELRENWQVEQTWLPDMAATERENLYRSWLKAINRSFNWID